MSLHWLPTDPVEDPLLDRICALQVARNNLGNAVQAGNAIAAALVIVVDELIEQLRERQVRS